MMFKIIHDLQLTIENKTMSLDQLLFKISSKKL